MKSAPINLLSAEQTQVDQEPKDRERGRTQCASRNDKFELANQVCSVSNPLYLNRQTGCLHWRPLFRRRP
jgi:hypothetical protein